MSLWWVSPLFDYEVNKFIELLNTSSPGTLFSFDNVVNKVIELLNTSSLGTRFSFNDAL